MLTIGRAGSEHLGPPRHGFVRVLQEGDEATPRLEFQWPIIRSFHEPNVVGFLCLPPGMTVVPA
jgi:hypothetical protein